MVSNGTSNISLFSNASIFDWLQNLLMKIGINKSSSQHLSIILISGLFVTIVTIGLYWFFGTEVGIAIRATGRNKRMAKSSGINTNLMIFIGLGLSNALIALAGALYAEQANFGDINQGKGTIIIGLATIILGESIFGKRSFKNNLISIILGSILYFLIIRIALMIGIDTNNLKLLYSIIIVIVLALPVAKKKIMSLWNHKSDIEIDEEKNVKEVKPEVIEKRKKKELLISQKEESLFEKEMRNPKLRLRYEKAFKELEGNHSNNNSLPIHIENLKKSFVIDGHEKKVLKGINIDIEPGEFITVIGGNGSGKSTFLNCIAGTYIPNNGKIFIGDNEVTNDKENQRAKYMSRVFQDPNMGTCGDMSIEQNMIVSYNRGKVPSLRWGTKIYKKKIFKEKLKTLNLELENRLTAKAGELSGGQRQALTLIMANLRRPDLLLLDEHCAALDPKTAATVMEVTNQLVNEGKITTIMVTHNMKDAIKYGNRLIMLNDGQIIYDVKGKEKQSLTVEDLLNKFKEKDTFEFDDTLILG